MGRLIEFLLNLLAASYSDLDGLCQCRRLGKNGDLLCKKMFLYQLVPNKSISIGLCHVCSVLPGYKELQGIVPQFYHFVARKEKNKRSVIAETNGKYGTSEEVKQVLRPR